MNDNAESVPDRADIVPNTTVDVLDARPCPVCAFGSVGAARMRDLHLGKISPYELAVELNCSVEEIMTHVNQSHEIQVNDTGEIQSDDIFLKKLGKHLATMEKWVGFLTESVNGKGDLDRSKVIMLTALIKEIRGAISDIAELQGRKGPTDQTIRIKTMEKQIIDITGLIIREVPPSCQVRIVEEMERLKLLPEKSSTAEIG